MVHTLVLQNVDIVNIFFFAHVLLVVDQRIDIGILHPSVLTDQSLFEIGVTVRANNLASNIVLSLVLDNCLFVEMGVNFILFFLFFIVFFVLLFQVIINFAIIL